MPKAPPLPALTGVRFLAALAVVVDHVAHSWRPGILPEGTIGRLTDSGTTAVAFFFTLSGFVLVYGYATSAGRLRGTPRAFLAARAARIYPAYLLAWLLALGPFLWSQSSHYAALPTGLLSLLLLQAWTSADVAWNGPGWSLSVEALFYASFTPVLAQLGRLRAIYLWLLVAGCWLLAAAYTLPAAHIPLMRLPEFVAGMCLGRLYLLRGTPWPYRTCLMLVGITGLVATLVLAQPGYAPPFLALLIAGLAGRTGRVVAALSTPTVVLLGEASYGLYILHAPLWAWMDHLGLLPMGTGLAAVLGSLAYGGFAVALSVAVFVLVESPIRPWLRTRLAPK